MGAMSTDRDAPETISAPGHEVPDLRPWARTYLAWRWFPWMVKDDRGYRLPEGLPRKPLMFSLTATKPLGVAFVGNGEAGAAPASV